MTAWRLAARGARVVVCDWFGVSTERSSSHGGTRIFRRAVFEGTHYLPLIELSSKLWAELGDIDPSARMLVTGGLTIGPSDGALVTKAVAATEAASIDFEILDSDELNSRYPQHVLLPGDVGVFEPGAGVLRAESVARAAIAEACRLGAVMHPVARSKRTLSSSPQEQACRSWCQISHSRSSWNARCTSGSGPTNVVGGLRSISQSLCERAGPYTAGVSVTRGTGG
jgi:glycine/D-amino acid oxidase-like deaminating enzyme